MLFSMGVFWDLLNDLVDLSPCLSVFLQLRPGHRKSLVGPPRVGGHVGSLRTFRQRQLGGEAFHAALPAKVSHLQS